MGIINESAGQDRGSCHPCLIGVPILDGCSQCLILKAIFSSLRKADRIAALTDATLRHVAPFKVYVRSHWIFERRVYLLFSLGVIETHLLPQKERRSLPLSC